MVTNGIYFGQSAIYTLIRSLGGIWNDAKERPIVCMIKSTEHEDLYWAIPVGNYLHRDAKAQARIQKYLNYDIHDIRSCFYHVGKTNEKSIFFISDVIPITDKYIEREYKAFGGLYIIKNPNLISELTRKLQRILSYENVNNNHFRQHITDVKTYLLEELNPVEIEDEEELEETDA